MIDDRFCPACGVLNHLAARYCGTCGSRMQRPAGVRCLRCGAMALPGDRFCDECGQTLPPGAVLLLEQSGWRVPLSSTDDAGGLIIGRADLLSGVAPDIDLAPYDAEAYGVSRRHGRLTRSPDGYALEDVGSVNLTYVNDQRLEPGHAVTLHDGDRILLGRLSMIFRQV